MKKIEEVGDRLPSNSLDELIDKLGGPNNVAEMTGRKGRVVANCDGRISYESRRETDVSLEVLNLTEKQRFMDGEKLIAIISEAASSGISLQVCYVLIVDYRHSSLLAGTCTFTLALVAR